MAAEKRGSQSFPDQEGGGLCGSIVMEISVQTPLVDESIILLEIYVGSIPIQDVQRLLS